MSGPICAYGEHSIGDDEYYYVVNPAGGYGLGEVLCCESCIKLPENSVAAERMGLGRQEEIKEPEKL